MRGTTIFVSDVHLSDKRENKVELFLAFLRLVQEKCEALYILGDLFDLWLGDDDDTAPHPDIITALRAVSDNGVALYIALGNRDFLLGGKFCERTGAKLLPDYTTIDLYGTKTLITHGDLLCTKDTKYQLFRKIVRHPLIIQIFLLIPLDIRKKIAHSTQTKTSASMRKKNNEIMDVEQKTVETMMNKHQVSLLIHGHTHRPNTHVFKADYITRQRIVLGDWYEQDSVLVCQENKRSLLKVRDYLM
jgi:UDP-2,3-diacylglucosamine hydrolase